MITDGTAESDSPGVPETQQKSRGEEPKIPLHEKVKWHAKRRLAEARGEIVQPRRDRFFSEAHPHFYAVVSTIGPRLHMFILVLILGWFIFKELARGNIDFALDWYYASPLPMIIEIVSDKELLKAYAPMIIALAVILVMLLFTIYIVPWRLAFKDYQRVIVNDWKNRLEIVTVPEGRLYWRTNNMWYQLWDSLYQSPKRKTVKLYLHRGWWPPLNIFSPPSSMITVEISAEETLEQRGLFEVLGHEKPYRWRSGLRQYRTRDTPYSTTESPLELSHQLFDDGVKRIVGEMRDLTTANSAIRLKQLASQTYGVEEEFLKMLEEDERKREGEKHGN